MDINDKRIKDRIYRMKYYSINKDIVNNIAGRKIHCDTCNIDIRYDSQFKHKKSKRHIMNSNSNLNSSSDDVKN